MSHGGGGGGGGGGHGGGGHGGFGGGHGNHGHGGFGGGHGHGGEHHPHYYGEPGGPVPFGYRSIWRVGFWHPRYYRSGVYINPGGCLLALVFLSIVGIIFMAQYRWVVITVIILCLIALIAFLSRKPANMSGGGGYQAPGQYPPNQQGGNPYYQAQGQYPPNQYPPNQQGGYQAQGQYPPNQQGGNPYYQAQGQYPPNQYPPNQAP